MDIEPFSYGAWAGARASLASFVDKPWTHGGWHGGLTSASELEMKCLLASGIRASFPAACAAVLAGRLAVRVRAAHEPMAFAHVWTDRQQPFSATIHNLSSVIFRGTRITRRRSLLVLLGTTVAPSEQLVPFTEVPLMHCNDASLIRLITSVLAPTTWPGLIM